MVESQVGIGTTVLAEVGLPHPVELFLDPDASFDSEHARPDKDRPKPTIENWAWLGQKLVIPVGQTWPWLPADQVHLRRPLVEPTAEPLTVEKDAGPLGSRRDYVLRVLQPGQQRTRLIRVHHGRAGYRWKSQGTSWELRHMRDLSGGMVLTRNKQSLAAMQYQGRLLNTWSEIVYDGRGYRMSCLKDMPDNCVLVDEAGDEVLFAADLAAPQIMLRRPLPLPLLMMVAMRIVDESLDG
jgi:hypothetical protein